MSWVIPTQVVLCGVLMFYAEVFGMLILQSQPKRVKFMGLDNFPPGKRDATPGHALYLYDSGLGNDDTEDANRYVLSRSREAYERPSESALNYAAMGLGDGESELRRWINPGAKFGRNIPGGGWDRRRRWLNAGAKYREAEDKPYRRWLNPGARIPEQDDDRDVGRQWLNAGGQYRSVDDFDNVAEDFWDDDVMLLNRRRRDVSDVSKGGIESLKGNDNADDKPSRAVRHASIEQQLQDSDKDRRKYMNKRRNFIGRENAVSIRHLRKGLLKRIVNGEARDVVRRLKFLGKTAGNSPSDDEHVHDVIQNSIDASKRLKFLGKRQWPVDDTKTDKRLKFLKRHYVNDDQPVDEKRLKFLGKRQDEYPRTFSDLAFTEAEAEKRLKFLKRQSDDNDIESQKRLKFLKRFNDDDVIKSDKRLKFLKKSASNELPSEKRLKFLKREQDDLPDKRLKFLKKSLPHGDIESEKRLKFLG